MGFLTFIIGNGLDLSIGLKTSYRDFYSHVLTTKDTKKNRIYTAIKDKPEDWADFELQLGKYTEYIKTLPESKRESESIQFHEELEELRDDLAEYLKIVEVQANAAPRLSGTGFFDELPNGQKNVITAHLNGNTLHVNFITLNYTQILDKVVEQNIAWPNRSVITYEPLHIHGLLDDSMALGVSNDSQLSSAMSLAERNDLIKPFQVESSNDDRLDRLRSSIARSDIIVIYGSSIGTTDQYIWELVIDRLTSNTDTRVIVHTHRQEFHEGIRRSPRKQRKFIESVQNSLLAHGSHNKDLEVNLRKQIYVIPNSKNILKSI